MTKATASLTLSEQLAVLAPDAVALFAVLADARQVIAVDLAVFVECSCTIDPASGEPIRGTLDPAARPHVQHLESLLTRLDAFLPGDAE